MNPAPTPNSPAPVECTPEGTAEMLQFAAQTYKDARDAKRAAPVDIARLRDLLAKATPGHWFEHWFRSGIPASKSDADFIAALRNAAPALLDEVERLREETNEQGVLLLGSDEMITVQQRKIDTLELARSGLLETVRLAGAAMNHMGDILNGMDAVEPSDVEKTKDAFAKVRSALEGNAGNELLAERDKLREEVESLREELENFRALAEQLGATKAVSERDSLRQQNERLLKEIEELKAKSAA